MSYSCDINKALELGGELVNEHEQRMLHELTLKVQQHEAAIAQLLEILAATNRKLTDISSKQLEAEGAYSQV